MRKLAFTVIGLLVLWTGLGPNVRDEKTMVVMR